MSIDLSSIASWEQLRKIAKNIEFDLDAKISLLNSIAALIHPGQFASTPYSNLAVDTYDPWIRTTSVQEKIQAGDSLLLEIEEKIQKLSNTIGQMPRANDSPATPYMNQHIQRHRDLLADYTQEFKKTKVVI